MESNYIAEEWKSFVAENEIEELAEIIEDGAAETLMNAKEVIPGHIIHESGLDRFSTKEELLADRDRLLEMSAYFSYKTMASSTGTDDDGLVFLELHMSDIILFGSTMLIDMAATLHHITFGVPMRLRIFTDEYDEDFYELAVYIAKMFDDVVTLDISVDSAGGEDEADPFEDEWNAALDELVCKYGGKGSHINYGNVVSMLLTGFCERVGVIVPAVYHENSESGMPYTFKCVTAKDGRKFLVLVTRPHDDYDEYLKIRLGRIFTEFENDELYGLVINPLEENLIIGRELIRAALMMYEKGVEHGKTLDKEDEGEPDGRLMKSSRPMTEEDYELAAGKIAELADNDPESFLVLEFTEYVEDDPVIFMQTKKWDGAYRVEIAFDMSDFGQKDPLILAADDVSLETTLSLFRMIGREGKTTDSIEFIENNFKDIGFHKE